MTLFSVAHRIRYSLYAGTLSHQGQQRRYVESQDVLAAFARSTSKGTHSVYIYTWKVKVRPVCAKCAEFIGPWGGTLRKAVRARPG